MQHPSHPTGAADVGTLVICAAPFFVCPAAAMLHHLIVTNIVLLPLHAACKLKKDGAWSIERLVLHHIRILILKIGTHLTCFLDFRQGAGIFYIIMEDEAAGGLDCGGEVVAGSRQRGVVDRTSVCWFGLFRQMVRT
jgi:hypothetical protein